MLISGAPLHPTPPRQGAFPHYQQLLFCSGNVNLEGRAVDAGSVVVTFRFVGGEGRGFICELQLCYAPLAGAYHTWQQNRSYGVYRSALEFLQASGRDRWASAIESLNSCADEGFSLSGPLLSRVSAVIDAKEACMMNLNQSSWRIFSLILPIVPA